MATDNDKHHRRLHLRHGVSPADGSSPAPPRAAALTDRLGGPTMIGIDEKTCGKEADKFLTVVTDHVTGKIAWIAGRARIPEFANLAKTLRHFLPLIWNTVDHGPSNGRAEAPNAQLTRARELTRARGFRTARALIAIADFVYGGLCPDSPY